MNENRLFGIICLVLVLFSAMSIASASDIADDASFYGAELQNTLNLADESKISISQDSFTQLNGKVQSTASGGTLTLDKNYTYSEGDIKTGIVISKDLTIDGRGYTINGAGKASIFKISGNPHVVLKNINFINAYGENGAALQLSADNNLQIVNSKFINNVALANGGAISVENSSTITSTITISNSLFVNNKASNGGAISAKGTLLNVVDSNFNNNNASNDGGSIYLNVGAYVDRCSFTNDYASHDGGAFFLNEIINDMTALPEALLNKYGIFNSRFISCDAGHDGGASYIYGNYGRVNNVTVIGCSAGNMAGAGYIDGDRGRLSDSTFINNSAARDAGAVMWTGMNGMLEGCRFINNTAKFGDSGALYLKPADNVSVFDGISIVNRSTFINNSANFNGGAIYASGIFVVIHNSQFMGDSAREGAGIYLDVGASIEYCTFIGEYAKHNGGAIYLSASNIEYTDKDSRWMQILLDNIGVRHSTIVNCSADYDGGAGYVAGNYGIVANVTMIGNTAGHDGGAGYILGSYGKLYNSTMINNRAARDGGALMWAGNHGLVDNVTCMLNSAKGGSGSVCVDGLNITILKSKFMLSNATLSGGAIYVYGDDATISDSLFDKCVATAYHGGAVYVSGRNAHIHNCNFTMNRVNVGVGCGGAINIEGNGTHILNCNFDKCTASEGGFVNIDGANVLIENVTGMHSFAVNGGAFYIDGDYATINNVDFEYNNATEYAGAIYVEGDFANLSNINLVRNIAYNRDGGAIYIAGSNTTITNANLVQNRVTGSNARGGAIYLQGDYTKIFNSTFDMCTAYDGGVIYINGSHALIDGYSCFRSLALNDGGAIYVAGDYAYISDFNISLTNSTNYGGAIYVAGDNLNIHNSNFTMCTAYNRNGGAIYVLGLNTIISKSNFVMNRVNTENGHGGSIAIHGNFTRIFNCTFERCTAYEGGVIYINGSYTMIDGYSCIMSFASNHGGAIFIEGDYASVADFNISLTNATNHGGAMYILGDFANVHNSNFTMCTADNRNGGALYVLGLNTTISESSFVMNKVNLNDGCGGSIAIHGNFTRILNCTFERCTAYDGGVIYINGYYTLIDGYSCLKSFAANNGGAIFIEGDNALIADFDISLTNATNYGGAIYVSGDFVKIHNSNFTRCIADNYDGGALYISGLNATVSDSTFVQNRVNNVSGHGGSVDITGNYTNLINCDFKMCSAYEGGVVNIEGSYTNIDGFTSNMTYATNNGGALYVAGDYVTVNDFSIGFCNATNDGAAIYITGDDDVNIMNGNLTTCIAVNGDGGAIYVGGYNTTIEGCNFDKTRALYGRGGAIFIEGDMASVEDSNFIRSFANDGGIIYISGHDAGILNNNLTYSWAVNAGGAIYIEGHDVLIANTNFAFLNASNSANEYSGFGGALYIEGNNVNITNSTFLRSIAEKGGSGGAIFILGENVNIEYSNFTYCASPDYLERGGGASAAGAIAIAGDDATVNGCYFQYATARNGAIMFIEGSNASIINSTLLNSYADYDGGAIYIFGENTNISGTSFYKVRSERHGGAVYIRFGENTNIEKSSFIKCNSTYGGAIDIDGSDVKISDSNLNDCFASTDGGAIYITGENVTMVRSNFTNSFVDDGNGGAIYWVGSIGLVDESNFINNTAPRLGGAIFMKENSKITFQNSNFVNNSAGINGGAIDFNRGAHDEIILNSTFENNMANRSAGAIFWFGTNGTIKNSNFINNKALGIINYTDSYGNVTYGGYGGAVMWTGAQGVVDNCTFINNYAQYNEATKSGGRGGAVYLQGSDVGNCHDTAFYNSIFINNTAGYNGGAVDWFRGAVNGIVENSTFINNTAHRSGGSIYWSGVNGTINNSTFENNVALGQITDANGGGDGGAVLWVGPKGNINSSNFINNKAAYSGGAIYLKGSDNGSDDHCDNVKIMHSVFENNFAGLNGGAVDYQEGATNGNVSYSRFINNTASRNGGAIFWFGHSGVVSKCVFVDNNALGTVDEDSRGVHRYIDANGNKILGGSGGAIAWIGDIGLVEDSDFINNSATRWGGAIFLRDNADTIFKNSNFEGNTAKQGGAIYWDENSTQYLINCVLTHNKAYQGSAIYLSQHNLEIINTILLDNRADSSELNLFVTRSDDNSTIEVIAELKGMDNLINAIWNDGDVIAFTNVTYLGVNGITNTGASRRTAVKLEGNDTPIDNDTLYQTQLEDYQNVTFYIYDAKNKLLVKDTLKTNISGRATFTYTNNQNTGKLYEFVFHKSDDYYSYIENSTSKQLAYAVIPANNIYYLENQTFSINVIPKTTSAPVPTGNVSVWIDGELLYENISLADGKSMEINLEGLAVGTYEITVYYSGDEVFLPRENATTFKVMKIPSFITLTAENYTYGEFGKIIIHIPQDENNTINITFNGQTYQVKINESGYGEFDIPFMPHGKYTVRAVYPETHNYLKSSNSTTFEIYPVYKVIITKNVNITGNASVGDLINFTITLSNEGSVNATNAIIRDKLPKYLEYVSSGANDSLIAEVDEFGVVTWNIDNFAAGSKLMLWVVVRASLDGSFANMATLNSTEINNVSNIVNVNVTPLVDLKINKTVNVSEVIVGDEIAYIITVLNNGPSDANEVNVVEKLSEMLSLIKIDTQFGYYDETAGIWHIGKLVNGTAATLTLTVKILMQGIIENIVSVTSKEMDSYELNNRYAADNVVVTKSDTLMNVIAGDISYGEDGEIVVNLPKDATGAVNITVDGKTYEIPVENGVAKLTLSDISGGNHDVNIVYSGDNKYNSNSTDAKFNVAPITPTIKIEAEDILFGEIEVLNVTVNAPGTVIITVDGLTIEIPLDGGVKTSDVLALANALNYDGKATWNLINLPLGAHKVFAVYKGNENYTSVNASAVFYVKADVGDVSVILSDINVGDDEIINIKYPEDATGDVTIIINGKSYTKPLRNGEVTFTIPKLKAGKYKVDIHYSGDDKYLPDESEGSFKVSKASKVKIRLTDDNIDFDGKKFTVTLPSDAKGTVTIEIGGKTYTKAVKNGKAVFELSGLKYGDYSIFVSYSGDDKYEGVSESFMINVDSDEGPGAAHDGKSYGEIASEGVNLSDYATSNPVWILLLICVVIGLIRPRRY